MPVMQVRARILHVKTLEKGESVSYGRTYTAEKAHQSRDDRHGLR